MNIPNEYTFKILGERKKYLILKLQIQGENKNGYILQEINALERLIDFSQLIINHFSNEQLKKVIDEYEPENNSTEKLADNEGHEIIYAYPINISKNHKLDVLFTKQKENNYIRLEVKKYINNKYKWENRGKFQFTAKMLEGILEKFHEIER